MNIQNEIKSITYRIIKKYKPEKIILFGSYAYGRPTKNSDIDIFIIKNTTKRRIDRFVEVKRIIYDSARKISVMPIVFTPKELNKKISIGDDFVIEILKKGKLLYAK